MTMRLIDAELLKQTTERLIKEEEQNGFYPKSWDEEVIAFKCLVDSMPSTEAKPIVHAHWNDDGRCTNCGGHAPFFAWTDEWFGTKFCPHCGAQIHKSISCNHEDDNHIAEDSKKGIKIPVISMEDVPKLAKEMEK